MTRQPASVSIGPMRTRHLALLSCVLAAGTLLVSCKTTQPEQGRYSGQQQRRDEASSRDVRRVHDLIREAGERIERAERGRMVSDREARSLRRELNEVRDQERRMSRDGWVDRRELDLLAKRVDDLHRQITRDVRN